MKRIVTILLIAVACLPGVALNAQNYKFGHIESQRIIVLMPEYTKAGDSLNVVRQKYELQAEKMQVDINKKIQ
jgi:outer membrane protein